MNVEKIGDATGTDSECPVSIPMGLVADQKTKRPAQSRALQIGRSGWPLTLTLLFISPSVKRLRFLVGLRSTRSLRNDGGGLLRASNITWTKSVNEFYQDRTEVNGASI
jgi:hypothetical protein